MKTRKFLKSLFMALMMLVQIPVFAQLSGSYTLNPTKAASSTNYKNWASVASDLLYGTRTDGGTAQGSGVSGAVTITVYDTVYANTQFKLFAVSGASSSNTITFKSAGGDSSKCMLDFPCNTNSSYDYVLMLDGADYIHFEGIGFVRSGNNTYYTAIQMLNGADYNQFSNCLIKSISAPSNTTKGWITGDGALVYMAGNADHTLFQNNHFVNGYNGIYTTQSCTGNEIKENTFDSIGCIGVYMTNQTSFKTHYNTFNITDFGSGKGHYVSYAIRMESSTSVEITHNKIFMTANNCQVVRGIVFVNMSGSSASPNLVNNNWILNSGGTSSCTGISLYGINYLDLYYNSFLITNSLSTAAIVHHNTTYNNTYVDIKNNNLINKGGGYVYDFPGSNGGLNNVDYNNAYTSGKTFGNYNGSAYSSLSAWQSGASKDANSLNLDPGYVSNFNLHVSNVGINAKATPYSKVSDDIDGESRDANHPDIGADEFFPANTDAGVVVLDSPKVFCAGSNNIKVKIQNFGLDTLKSASIKWSMNGKAQTTYSWSGKLAPGKASTSLKLGSFTFYANTPYKLKIWTENPNSKMDGNNKNDSLVTTIYTGLSGKFYVGDTSTADFKSFNNAISALATWGICDSVTFLVYDGIYKEQITFNQLPGMGAGHDVVFKGLSGDSSKVVVSLPSSSATGNNNACIQLNGADYVTFSGITFQRTGSLNQSEVLHILNNSNHNTFSHCQFINTTSNTSTTAWFTIWSDQAQDNYNRFEYNYVANGSYNVYYVGETSGRELGTVFEGNVFTGANGDAVYFMYNDGIEVIGNTFKASNTYVAGSVDLKLNSCSKDVNISGNYFYNNNSDVSVNLSQCSATSGAPALISNNFIAKNKTTGFSLDEIAYYNIVYNSIRFNGKGTSNAGIYFTTNTSSNITLKNNNIVMLEGYALSLYKSSYVSSSDYNNFFTFGKEFVVWNNTIYKTLSALKTGSGMDAHSLSVNPLFISNTDLHIISQKLQGAATPLTYIHFDIDGDKRDANHPDMGADEIAEYPNDAGIIRLYNPKSQVCEGVEDIEVIVRNFGTDTLKKTTIEWSVDNVAQKSYAWTGALAYGEQDTLVIAKFNFLKNTNPEIKLWTALPNGKSDGFIYNDTLKTSRSIDPLPAASAGLDANLCPGDSVLIGGVPKPAFTYRWFDFNMNYLGNSGNIYVKPSKHQAYIVEVTSKNTGCINYDTTEVFIRSLPVPDFKVNKKNQCLHENDFYFTNKSTNASNYFWEFGDGDTTSLQSTNHKYKALGSYKVLLRATTMFGCSDTISTIVYTRPHPNSSFKIIDNEQCLANNVVDFDNTSSGDTSSYWDFADGQTSMQMEPTYSYNIAGEYRVKLISSTIYGCTDSSFRRVWIYPQPSAKIEVNDSSQCLNDNRFEFDDQSEISSGTLTYSWDLGDGTSKTDTFFKHSYAAVGTYEVWLKVTSDKDCTDSTSINVRVKPHPVIDLGENDTLYNEESKVLDAGSGFDEYIWSTGEKTQTITVDSVKYGTGDKVFSVTVIQDECDGSDSVKITFVRLVSINEADINVVKIYPNPVQHKLYLDFGSSVKQYNCILTDINGRKLNEFSVRGKNSIDVQTLPKGLYLLNISDGTNSWQARFIRQ